MRREKSEKLETIDLVFSQSMASQSAMRRTEKSGSGGPGPLDQSPLMITTCT